MLYDELIWLVSEQVKELPQDYGDSTQTDNGREELQVMHLTLSTCVVFIAAHDEVS